MQKFWILWGYVANFSDNCIEIEAETADKALEKLSHSYSPAFRDKAIIHVFSTPPALISRKGVTTRSMG
jgi:acylphosphatase